jgi:hypothetical protein
MITCPYCGTSYAVFQANCRNCGGSLPIPPHVALATAEDALPPAPPPAPRTVPRHYVWRVLFTDSAGLVGSILGGIGAVFTLVGAGLTAAVITAFVGIPFLVLGLVFLAVGASILAMRYKGAQQTVYILQLGESALGRIVDVAENVHVQVNGRFPWTITYAFQVGGVAYEGKVTTLSAPSVRQQPGKPVYVLYLPEDPTRNAVYPHPFGYWTV